MGASPKEESRDLLNGDTRLQGFVRGMRGMQGIVSLDSCELEVVFDFGSLTAIYC